MVGERIRYYRKRQKMTLRELGEKSGFENRGDVRIAQYEKVHVSQELLQKEKKISYHF